MPEANESTLLYREKLLSDPYRPGYHFVAMDKINIGDPNGAFYADGKYHLMYLYVYKSDEKGDHCHWGHISSPDLLHWRHHKDALRGYKGDNGCYSGGAYVDDDGTAYITFWKFPSVDPEDDRGGTAIAYAKPPYDDWIRIEPIAIDSKSAGWGIVDLEVNGELIHVCNADPGNIWKMNGYYYIELGNKPVLEAYGREETSNERYKGGWTDLFKSKDLKNWEYVHRFIDNDLVGEGWPDQTEDHMCSCFLPLPDSESNGNLTDKWLEMFISHNIGAQYFIGNLDECKMKFNPTIHGRFTWKDRTCFAPEGMLDHKNRQIAWFVLHDDLCDYVDPFEWFGVYTFPRCLWLEDGCLHMSPAEEITAIQRNHQLWDGDLPPILPVKNGRSFRLQATIPCACAGKYGFTLLYDPTNGQGLNVYVDTESNELVFDGSNCGKMGKKRRENHRYFQIHDVEKAPFRLKENEPLFFDVLVDRCVVEVYVNKRQAISRRYYPDHPNEATAVLLLGENKVGRVETWEVMETNMY